MELDQPFKVHVKRNLTVSLAAGTANNRKYIASTSSGCQHSPRFPEAQQELQPRSLTPTPTNHHAFFRDSGIDWEMQDIYSDDALEDDEETGLTSADKSKRRKKKKRNTRLDERIAHTPQGDNEEKQLAYQQLIKESVINAVLIAAWYAFSIGISVFNKYVLSRDKLDFSYPLFFTSFHMIIQFILASTIMYFIPSLRPQPVNASPSDTQYQQVTQSNQEEAEQVQPRRPIMTKFFYLTRITPCGAATGLDIGLGNMSLQFISLTFYTMCKSSVLGFVLLFAFLFRLEKPSWKLAAIIATMAAGVIMMVAGELAFSKLGFALVMAASFFSGFRWSLTQILLIRNPATSNPFSSIFFLAPVMFLSLVIIAIPVEGPANFIHGFQTLVDKRGAAQAIGVLVFPGFLAFLMTASEFALLKRTSVVTLSVCGIFKEVLTITAAATTFGDELTVINFSGLVVTIASIATYNYIKFKGMKEEAKKDAQITIQRRASILQTGDRRRVGSASRGGDDIPGENHTNNLIRNSLSVFPEEHEDTRRAVSASLERTSPLKRPEDLE
ncbi:TPT-domain-containing protein [Myriangium duriaei CBS 260.36]|uniref:TPT-domain-containing protein n=1 Tax=Myriangium duriaei CBS 260.36 TaxID=1168546 RepID=A0A9P4J9T6_9PEZI|nr:TPT-domain-containing protein [Myriangium duriaei CBS 260.36]